MEENRKPECYGDTDYYDPDDDTCQECAYIDGCGIRAARTARTSNRRSPYKNTTYNRTSSSVSSNKNSIQRSKANQKITIIEADEQDTFQSTLAHNAALEAMQAVVDEVANSIRHIPRKSYNNLWKRNKK